MLTAIQRRYLDICRAYKGESPRPTRKALANRFGCSPRTVANAITFGTRYGFFTDDLTERLSQQLVEWQQHLEWLESEQRYHINGSKEKGKRVGMHPFALSALSREIREVRTKVAELQGIYRQTLNISVDGDLNHSHFIAPDRFATAEEWEEHVRNAGNSDE